MNEELQRLILQMLNGTKDFVISEAPDVLKQFLQMQLIYAYFYSVCGLLGMWVTFLLIRKGFKEHRDYEDCFGYFFTAFGVGIFSFYFLLNFPDIITIQLAPKGYLMDHLIFHRNH